MPTDADLANLRRERAKPRAAKAPHLVAGYIAAGAVAVAVFLLIRALGQGLVAQGVSGFGRAPIEADIATFTHVLVALLVIIATSRATGALFRFLGQPAVIGEISAGIVLGPSLLGQVAPEVSTYLFPASLAPFLGLIAQAGVVAFMFLVGLEFDSTRLGTGRRAALIIAHAGITVPFIAGAGLALAIYPIFATADVPFTVFAMFMGISMSVTAFPVLARILIERRLQSTAIGATALTCAAIDDATAWCLLALCVGVARATPESGLITAYLTIGYVILMFAIVRPVLTRLVRRDDDREPSDGTLALVVGGVLLSALATEAIGIHAVFGAFLMGVMIPHDSNLARRIVDNLKSVILVVLLPVFFAFTGLRTEMGLISGVGGWLLCGLLTLVACAGKFGGCLAAARFAGIHWRDAAILATLMNTRGLMELIVLNIGLDLKIISPTLFTMLVVMALVTTFLTTPVLDLLSRGRSVKVASPQDSPVTV